ncbi:hypothetical protein K8R14_00635 [bacterium]|nr:hypothetical protein [bacterium]
MTDNTKSAINESIYLVTKKCDVTNLSKNQRGKDLGALKKAEARSKKRRDITFGKKDSEATRAMGALSIMNPFKGV